MSEPRLLRRPELWLAAVIVLLDQVTKMVVLRTIALHGTVEVVPGLLNLTHVQNTGAAFGLLNDVHFPGKSVVVVVIALGALAAIGVMGLRLATTAPLRLAIGLVLGGAVGNLIDRATMGYVIDFVDAYWRDWHFWAFNVADAAITVGTIVMLLDFRRMGSHVPSPV